MSKQSDAKEAQGYIEKANCCATCESLTFDLKMPAWMIGVNDRKALRDESPVYDDSYALQKNLRCGLGGFKAKKMGVCNKFAAKQTA